MKSTLKQALNRFLLFILESVNKVSVEEMKQLINDDVARLKAQSFNDSDIAIITLDTDGLSIEQVRRYEHKLRSELSALRETGIKTKFLVIPTTGSSKVSSLEKIGDKKLQELGLARLH